MRKNKNRDRDGVLDIGKWDGILIKTHNKNTMKKRKKIKREVIMTATEAKLRERNLAKRYEKLIKEFRKMQYRLLKPIVDRTLLILIKEGKIDLSNGKEIITKGGVLMPNRDGTGRLGRGKNCNAQARADRAGGGMGRGRGKGRRNRGK